MTSTHATRFLTGLSTGLLLGLGIVAANDHYDLGIPSPRTASAEVVRADGDVARELVLLTAMPHGVTAYFDGRPADVIPQGEAIRIPVPGSARSLEFRSELGTLWSTRLEAAVSDTLRPLLGGELVVEVERQGPKGTVLLDGNPLGDAPGSFENVPPGWHVVSILQGERVAYQDACWIVRGEITVVLAPPPPPKGKGRLVVGTRTLSDAGPGVGSGDAVFVDGKPRGETPQEIMLSAGFHSISVHREGHDPQVDVLYLPAGQSRHIAADFTREDLLRVETLLPGNVGAGRAAAVPVRIDVLGESVALVEGSLFVVQPGQTDPLEVPLVPSGTDPKLWVAVVPSALLRASTDLQGFARAKDDRGRTGVSEIFSLEVR